MPLREVWNGIQETFNKLIGMGPVDDHRPSTQQLQENYGGPERYYCGTVC